MTKLSTTVGQLEEHARLVRRLQQAWAKYSMHVDCGTDDLLREVDPILRALRVLCGEHDDTAAPSMS